MSSTASTYLAALQSSLARNAIRRVTIRSAVSPDVVLEGSEIFGPGTLVNPQTGAIAAPGEPGVPIPARAFELGEALLRFSKPEFMIETPTGMIHVAPYGQATVNLFWPILLIGGASVAALFILAARGVAK